MKFNNLRIVDHPLVQQKLCCLRSKDTNTLDFRAGVREISKLMVYEAMGRIPVEKREVETPLEKTFGYVLARPVTLIPVIRAGMAMCEGVLELIPDARVGHVGIYRDEKTFQPIEYYLKFPGSLAGTEVIVVDPMLATGGTAVAALDAVKERGGEFVTFVCLVAAPEGVHLMKEHHPEVMIYTAALDRELNQYAYILPGLGDAGDRIYGTEE